jgi:putative endonuclease
MVAAKSNMYYVYILRSQRDGKLYTGYSANLKRRIQEHKQKKTHTTARMGKISLIYYEAFISEKDARDREKYLKTTQGKRTLKLMLKYTFAPFVPRMRAKHHTGPCTVLCTSTW